MAAITAKMVNELRSMTGAGMMDCKKALVETEGNFDEAIKRLAKPDLTRYRIATSEEGHRCNLAEPVKKQIEQETANNHRHKPREQAPDDRIHNFDEVSMGFTEEQAVAEAHRCLHCKRPLCVGQCPVSIRIPDFNGPEPTVRLYIDGALADEYPN